MAQPLRNFLVATLAAAALPAMALNDPMAPPRRPAPGSPAAVQTSAVPSGVLLWTLVGGQTPLAWYAGRLVQIGDVVEGGQIVAIAEDHIIIAARGRHHRLTLIAEGWREPTEPAGQERPTGGKHVNQPTKRKPALPVPSRVPE